MRGQVPASVGRQSLVELVEAQFTEDVFALFRGMHGWTRLPRHDWTRSVCARGLPCAGWSAMGAPLCTNVVCVCVCSVDARKQDAQCASLPTARCGCGVSAVRMMQTPAQSALLWRHCDLMCGGRVLGCAGAGEGLLCVLR